MQNPTCQYLPVLKQVLCILYLILGAYDGNYTIIWSFQWFINFDWCTGFMTNLFNPLPSFSNNWPCQLIHRKSKNQCEPRVIQTLTKTHKKKIYIKKSYIFWNCDLCCYDRSTYITIWSTACMWKINILYMPSVHMLCTIIKVLLKK